MKITSLVGIGILTTALASIAAFQDASVEPATFRPTPASAAAEMFLDYCAPCHGLDGTGSGPVSPALKARTTDLTVLTKRNHGEFPAERVKATIRGDLLVVAHGPKDMPVWGPLFRYLGDGGRPQVTVRIENLTRYIASLQVPTPHD